VEGRISASRVPSVGAGTGAETPVHLGVESVRRSQSGEQRAEHFALLGIERSEQLRVLPFCRLAEPSQRGTAGVGEVEPMMPAVVGIARARDQAGALEGIDEDDHTAGHGPEPVGEGALTETGIARQDPQRAGGGRREAGGLHEFGEECGGERSELGEEETRVRGSAGFVHALSIVHLTE
jgi:hypothetical protein